MRLGCSLFDGRRPITFIRVCICVADQALADFSTVAQRTWGACTGVNVVRVTSVSQNAMLLGIVHVG